MTYFGTEEKGLAYWCCLFSDIAKEGGREDEEGRWFSAEQAKEITLKLLDDEKRNLEILKEGLEEKEDLELQAHVASLALPVEQAMAKHLRYETTIERQLYRAIDQLERLQRQRLGHAVPAPINIDVKGMDDV